MYLLGTTYDTSISLGFTRITSRALQSRCFSCVLSIPNLAPFACKIPNPVFRRTCWGVLLSARCVTCSSAIEICSLDLGEGECNCIFSLKESVSTFKISFASLNLLFENFVWSDLVYSFTNLLLMLEIFKI